MKNPNNLDKTVILECGKVNTHYLTPFVKQILQFKI